MFQGVRPPSQRENRAEIPKSPTDQMRPRSHHAPTPAIHLNPQNRPQTSPSKPPEIPFPENEHAPPTIRVSFASLNS